MSERSDRRTAFEIEALQERIDALEALVERLRESYNEHNHYLEGSDQYTGKVCHSDRVCK